MKGIIATFLLFSSLFFNHSLPSSWIIENRFEKGITKIQFTERYGMHSAKIWASCAPNDCFWGIFQIRKVGSQHHFELIRANPDRKFLPVYETIVVKQSHATKRIQVDKHRYNDYYRVREEIDFTNPSRKDKTHTYVFDKK
ncbi:MAG: hypothetical protein AAF694_19445 [Bacteroidota bacterium]